MEDNSKEWTTLCDFPYGVECPEACFSTDRVTIRDHGVSVELTSGQLKVLIEEARKQGLHQG